VQREYTFPVAAVGTQHLGLTLPANRQIRGVSIDNPSGSWLLVTTTGDTVPPYTLGWSRFLNPPALTVGIRFINSPTGTLSNPILDGGPIVVTLDTNPQPNSTGYASGAAAQNPNIPAMEWTWGSLTTVGGLAQGFSIVPLLADRRSVLVHADVRIYTGMVPSYGIVNIDFVTSPVILELHRVTLSPSSPARTDYFTPGLITSGYDNRINIGIVHETALPPMEVGWVLGYYRERRPNT